MSEKPIDPVRYEEIRTKLFDYLAEINDQHGTVNLAEVKWHVCPHCQGDDAVSRLSCEGNGYIIDSAPYNDQFEGGIENFISSTGIHEIDSLVLKSDEYKISPWYNEVYLALNHNLINETEHRLDIDVSETVEALTIVVRLKGKQIPVTIKVCSAE